MNENQHIVAIIDAARYLTESVEKDLQVAGGSAEISYSSDDSDDYTHHHDTTELSLVNGEGKLRSNGSDNRSKSGNQCELDHKPIIRRSLKRRQNRPDHLAHESETPSSPIKPTRSNVSQKSSPYEHLRSNESHECSPIESPHLLQNDVPIGMDNQHVLPPAETESPRKLLALRRSPQGRRLRFMAPKEQELMEVRSTDQMHEAQVREQASTGTLATTKIKSIAPPGTPAENTATVSQKMNPVPREHGMGYPRAGEHISQPDITLEERPSKPTIEVTDVHQDKVAAILPLDVAFEDFPTLEVACSPSRAPNVNNTATPAKASFEHVSSAPSASSKKRLSLKRKLYLNDVTDPDPLVPSPHREKLDDCPTSDADMFYPSEHLPHDSIRMPDLHTNLTRHKSTSNSSVQNPNHISLVMNNMPTETPKINTLHHVDSSKPANVASVSMKRNDVTLSNISTSETSQKWTKGTVPVTHTISNQGLSITSPTHASHHNNDVANGITTPLHKKTGASNGALGRFPVGSLGVQNVSVAHVPDEVSSITPRGHNPQTAVQNTDSTVVMGHSVQKGSRTPLTHKATLVTQNSQSTIPYQLTLAATTVAAAEVDQGPKPSKSFPPTNATVCLL
jgi:hypothetical protein